VKRVVLIGGPGHGRELDFERDEAPIVIPALDDDEGRTASQHRYDPQRFFTFEDHRDGTATRRGYRVWVWSQLPLDEITSHRYGAEIIERVLPDRVDVIGWPPPAFAVDGEPVVGAAELEP
jgi:hypothetical protein